jgi:hypothetical protein
MNDPEPTLQNLSGEAALLQFSAHPRWPQFPATLERLKEHPIAPAPKQAPKIDLEPHANYLESP